MAVAHLIDLLGEEMFVEVLTIIGCYRIGESRNHFDSGDVVDHLDKALTAAGWTEWTEEARKLRAEGRRVGKITRWPSHVTTPGRSRVRNPYTTSEDAAARRTVRGCD